LEREEEAEEALLDAEEALAAAAPETLLAVA
jgi:hypothetical protein